MPPRQCTLALMNAQKLALDRAGSFADRCANKSRHCRCVYANSHPTGEITRFPVGPHSLRNTYAGRGGPGRGRCGTGARVAVRGARRRVLPLKPGRGNRYKDTRSVPSTSSPAAEALAVGADDTERYLRVGVSLPAPTHPRCLRLSVAVIRTQAPTPSPGPDGCAGQ